MTISETLGPSIIEFFTPLTDTLVHDVPIENYGQPTMYETFIAPFVAMNPFLMFHVLSPFLYMGFVNIITQILAPCPNSGVVLFARKCHNIILSVLSAIMLGMCLHESILDGKIWGIHTIICKPYAPTNDWMVLAGSLFLYSKYLEWGDTLFLHLGGKPISMLQYTHHMTTSIFVYICKINNVVMPMGHIFMLTNCFVHVPMYWYFAFPHGFLYPYRRFITQIQIVQHIFCIATTIYSFVLDDCNNGFIGRCTALSLYTLYLVYFAQFYIRSYLKKKKLT